LPAVFSAVGWNSVKARHKTILVVEDDPNDQFLIETAFQRIGCAEQVHLVNDGAEAIAYMCGEGQYADRERFAYPTFIMTDLKMPRVDGFGVLEFLRKNPEWSITPAVVFSASHDTDDIKKCYALGATSYHVKPQNLEKLCQQLKVLLDYWQTCEVPEADVTGKRVQTRSEGKIGERFPQGHSAESAPRR
jgi:CheY-like chemotaxis protein